MWTKARSFNPKELKDLKHLSKAIIPLLKNEAVVANIPHHVGQEVEGKPNHTGGSISVPAGEPAEPVTCFLLNLNSILLSDTPSKNLDAQRQDASPFPGRKKS